MKNKPYFALLVVLALCSLSSAVGATPMHSSSAATPPDGAIQVGQASVQGVDFRVNSSADDANAHDWLPGDGLCVDSLWRCTLRAAIEEANAWPGADTISFDSSMYIGLDSVEGALPSITEQLRIDASDVWDGTNDRPGVTVNGGNQSFSGLFLSANNCEVYGLFLINFTQAVYIWSAYNTIGGPLQGQRNVLSSNGGYGVSIHGAAAHHNVVQSNWIGLSITGDSKQPNHGGLRITGGAYENIIGGDTLGERNFISGNTYNGVEILDANSDGNWVVGNRIGLPAVGSQDVGNGGTGVYISNGPRNTQVGGSGDGQAGNLITMNSSGVGIWGADSNWVETNTIVENKTTGVTVKDGAGNHILASEIVSNTQDGVLVGGATAIGNAILGNSIHNNGYKGIKLIEGGNTELAAPRIATANAGGASGTGCADCTVHLFSDIADEGETYHGFADVDGKGNWSYSGALTGPYVTATNTDADGNTSEFSAPFAIGDGTCDSPLTISCDQQLSGDTTGYANYHTTYQCSTWDESGPEVIYRFTLAAGSTYSVTATLSNDAADHDVFLLAAGGCQAGQCLAGGSYGGTQAVAENVPPGTYYVAVDGFGGATGTFTLDLACSSRPYGFVFLPLALKNW